MVEGKHEHFGLAIKNARIDCGLTQETLEEMAGISCRYLIAIEHFNLHKNRMNDRRKFNIFNPADYPILF